jgi:hypothetical protein
MERGIRVRTFDQEFVEEIRALNAAFIDDQLGPGLVITEVQPAGSDAIAVTEDHRTGRAFVQVRTSVVVVRGIYRTRPPEGHRIRLFVRRDTSYYPQAPIDFRYDRDNRMWECPSAWLLPLPAGIDNEIEIADLSEDLMVAVRHYSDVYKTLQEKVAQSAWVGIQMDPEPPGFKKLAGVIIRAGM